MRKLKAELVAYNKDGFPWDKIAYIGMLEILNRIKFGREDELHELAKDMKEPD